MVLVHTHLASRLSYCSLVWPPQKLSSSFLNFETANLEMGFHAKAGNLVHGFAEEYFWAMMIEEELAIDIASISTRIDQ